MQLCLLQILLLVIKVKMRSAHPVTLGLSSGECGVVLPSRHLKIHYLPYTFPFEALRYKLEGRGFDSRWCHWIISLT